MLDEGEITGSTPRVPPTNTIRGEFSGLESPYEAMKREMKNEEGDSTALHSGGEEEEDDSTILFAQRTARLPDMAMTPSRDASTVKDQSTLHGNKDPLLHRVLDKNYRIQATPHKPASRMSPVRGSSHKKLQPWQDSPMSSPEMAVPQLRSEAFMSPFKSNARQRLAAATQQQAPRTPGVSVQTPGTQRGKTRDVFAPTGTPGGKGKEKDEIDWDDEDEGDLDLYGGMSPPKTIQFALPPSKLLQTPGKSIPLLLALPKRKYALRLPASLVLLFRHSQGLASHNVHEWFADQSCACGEQQNKPRGRSLTAFCWMPARTRSRQSSAPRWSNSARTCWTTAFEGRDAGSDRRDAFILKPICSLLHNYIYRYPRLPSTTHCPCQLLPFALDQL